MLSSSARFAGSAAEAAEAPAEGLARSLQGVEVFDLSGKAVPVVELWRDRKAVVAFARHFGSVTHHVPS
jgi:meiotic recombination protein SPO11